MNDDDYINENKSGFMIMTIPKSLNPKDIIIIKANLFMNTVFGYDVNKHCIGKSLGESFPEFVKTIYPQKYIDCWKNGQDLEYTIKYTDQNIRENTFNVYMTTLMDDKIIVNISSNIRNNALNSITTIHEKCIEETSVEIVCEIILSEMMTILLCDHGMIMFYKNNKLVPLLFRSKTINIKKSDWPNHPTKKDSFFSRIMLSKKPIIINDVENDQQCQLSSQHLKINNILGFPLIFRHEVLGIVCLANSDSGFNDHHVYYSKLLAVTCSNLIKNVIMMNEILKEKETKIEEHESISKSKDVFLANMSHEIRTPLNGIIGMTRILMDTKMTEEQLEYASIVNQCGFQLLEIINDILDFSKMQAKRMSLNVSKFNLKECIDQSFETISSRAIQKKMEVRYYIDIDVPTNIIGDSVRIRQILINLITNAIKFSDIGGEVMISVSSEELLTDSEKKKYKLSFKVKDSGIGIPEKEWEKLFKTFSQVENKNTPVDSPGTGLGLAICKHLVELMDGKIWLEESQIGRGSIFVFEIIVEEHVSLDIETFSSIIKEKNILVVDDNQTNRLVICNMLLGWKMKPIMCSSGEEALMYIKNKIPLDLCLIDICMPNINGIQLAKRIKTKISVPMIALSSIGETFEDKDNLFIHRISKPIKQSRLYNACVNVFQNPNMTTQMPIIQEKNTRILIAEDIETNQKVIVKILSKLGYKNVKVVSNGLEVLQILRKEKFNVLFLDLKMPIMDGYITSKEINREFPDTKPHIIAVTATVVEREKLLCKEYGMDGYISKPIDYIELETILKIIDDKTV